MDEFARPRKGLRALDIRGAGVACSGFSWYMAAATQKLGRREDDPRG